MDRPEPAAFALAPSFDPFPAVQAWVELEGVPLSVARMRWREGLGRAYEVEVEVVGDGELVPSRIVGRSVRVTMRRAVTERQVHGVVRSVRLLSDPFGRSRAALQVVPALALCGMNRRSRIFQDMTVPEIAREVLRPALEARGSAIDVTRLARASRKRDYCVQYRESDLAFVERLLADESITYVFEHDGDREVVVLLDPEQIASPLETSDGIAELEVRDSDRIATRESIHGIDHAEQLRLTRARVRRWDWAMPTPGPLDHLWEQSRGATQLESISDENWAELELDVHDRDRAIENPDGTAIDDGDRIGALLLNAESVRTSLVRMASDAVGALPGARFDLHGTAIDDAYVVTEVVHRFENATTTAQASRHTEYGNDITVLAANIPWQTPSPFPRPVIAGVQTATVIGPPGEDVHTDAHGRIRVLMHWDREGRSHRETNLAVETSCWLRVVQSWAGPGHGAQFIPRVGTQVLVAFLDGDADRPICIGALYDGHDRPPFDLPDDRTRSGWRTRSTRGDIGYNELSFEDQVDREEIRIRAQRDLNEHVLATHSTHVGANRHNTIAGARSTKVARGDELLVHGGLLTQTFGARRDYVEGAPTSMIMPGEGKPFKKAVISHSQIVGGEHYMQCTNAIRIHGASSSVGQPKIELDADEIRFEVGNSKIIMTPEGIVIETDGFIRAAGGIAQMWLRPTSSIPASVEFSAPTLLASSEGARLTMDQQAKLTSSKSVELEQGESKLKLDGKATLASQHIALEAKTFVEIVSDATCMIDAAITEISGATTRIEGTDVTVADTSGGTIAIAGGIIRLN